MSRINAGLLLSGLLMIAGTAFAQDNGANKPNAVEIDPEQQIWLQLPKTTVPVQGGVHFVVVDVLITEARHAPYVCRIYPRLNEKIQFVFSETPPTADRKGELEVTKYGKTLEPGFNEALQAKLVKRIKVFDGMVPKKPDEDIAIMECQGSAAILRAKTQLRDLLRRQK
jgi:hypothetical protein